MLTIEYHPTSALITLGPWLVDEVTRIVGESSSDFVTRVDMKAIGHAMLMGVTSVEYRWSN